MIGVLHKPGQAGVVEEFFELFKTPWEVYRPGKSYDVVLATADDLPELKARLVVICGAGAKSVDGKLGVAGGERRQSGKVTAGDLSLPIYRDLATFGAKGSGSACVSAGAEAAGLIFEAADSTVIRLGYDLFDEVEFLLTEGQPIEQAAAPTLDLHITLLRKWMLAAGVSFLEISPAPGKFRFAVCLTHDIDFVAIRDHWFDHSMLGFVYRATFGGLRNFLRGRLSFAHLLKSWLAVASLPFVYAGWAKDFWEPFDWYLEVEKDLPATYFLIPFKRRPGEKVTGSRASRRGTAYDIADLPAETANLLAHGCELGVHGIDAWHSVNKGREELGRVAALVGEKQIGIRMHWLLRDAGTPAVLEQAGYQYDSTVGYNETIGYRAGTGQVFRPQGAKTLLELPMHIQDGALFYPQRLDLSEAEAEERCQSLIDHAIGAGGVLTLLWHDRSHGPERFWGGFYAKLVAKLRAMDCWFGSAGQVVSWFEKRRQVRFAANGGALRYDGAAIDPPLQVKIYPAARRGTPAAQAVEISWDGRDAAQFEQQIAAQLRVTLPETSAVLS